MVRCTCINLCLYQCFSPPTSEHMRVIRKYVSGSSKIQSRSTRRLICSGQSEFLISVGTSHDLAVQFSGLTLDIICVLSNE